MGRGGLAAGGSAADSEDAKKYQKLQEKDAEMTEFIEKFDETMEKETQSVHDLGERIVQVRLARAAAPGRVGTARGAAGGFVAVGCPVYGGGGAGAGQGQGRAGAGAGLGQGRGRGRGRGRGGAGEAGGAREAGGAGEAGVSVGRIACRMHALPAACMHVRRRCGVQRVTAHMCGWVAG